ncbi:hypothetical protein ACFYO5_21220 [Streptomyces sp. NPDC006259]|uniref:hypothetical protein n=1 Tax=Streptomyces sp. NPDC006259 TaxID=3364740 RepID=UPI0036D1B787
MRTPESGPPAPDALPPARPDADAYSATVLASHWVQRPDPDPGPTPGPTVVIDTAAAPPDGTVLRFGPGVPAALARHPRPTPPTLVAAPAPRRRPPRRHALPVLVLVAAVLFLLWRQDAAAAVGVRDVSVTAARRTLGCDTTADVVGVVRTDGRPGTLAYRWVRSDGTTSAVRHTAVARGQRQVRLRLLWTFQGPGRHAAVAELRLLSPERRSAEVRFAYDCS